MIPRAIEQTYETRGKPRASGDDPALAEYWPTEDG